MLAEEWCHAQDVFNCHSDWLAAYAGNVPTTTVNTILVVSPAIAIKCDEHALPAARVLATARPDVIIFGCASAGGLRGNHYEDQLIEEIQEQTGVVTLSVMKCARSTLQELGASSLVVVTPYIDELNERIRASLETDGFDVLAIRGLQFQDALEIARVTRLRILNLADEAIGRLKPDALFLSCTNFPAMEALSELHGKYNFPVTSSKRAALDKAIAEAQKPTSVKGREGRDGG